MFRAVHMPKLVHAAHYAVLALFVLGDEELQLVSTSLLQLPLISHLLSQAKIDGFLLLRIATNYVSIQLFESLLYLLLVGFGVQHISLGKRQKRRHVRTCT